MVAKRINEQKRIEVLDFLRGIASLAVCLFHFTNILAPDGVRTVTSYGWLGVQVFFVISGFIIPYSLYRGGYQLRRFPIFVLKRIVRLDPPYLVTIAIILLLGYLSWVLPYDKNGVFHVTFMQVILHLGYLNTFFQYEWLSDVFWTLAIELQYYILIGLVFPLVASRKPIMRGGAVAALGALAFIIPSPVYVFYYIFLFLMGICIFQYRVGIIDRTQCALLLAIIIPCCFWRAGAPIAMAGALSTFAILFLRVKNRVFDFLGSISYSLYLLHSPIGRRALNLGLRLTGAETELAKMLLIVWAVGASIVAAYVMYKLVELPSQRLSASLRYERRPSRDLKLTTEEIEQLNPAL